MRNLKIVMMGAGGVGKTSMTTQFVKEVFDERLVQRSVLLVKYNKNC